MRRYLLHDTFNIYRFSAERWEHPVHKHTYYEIIFILKGKGKHNLNGNTVSYRSGDVFLLGPEDYHSFDIDVPTEFCYVRFSEQYPRLADNSREWQNVVRTLLGGQSSTITHSSIAVKEKKQLLALLNILMAEYEKRHEPHFTLIRDGIMKSMMSLMARSIRINSFPNASVKSSTIEDILVYIRENIHHPERLSIGKLAARFHYAPTYLGIFFRKQTGESLKQYMIKHKLRLIETRLLYSNESLSSIAHEFNFSDESHFTKLFRKYNGVTPGTFRKRK
jgi:AraC family transcriptional regulator, L-rhamnose operon regulatory protein RhaS